MNLFQLLSAQSTAPLVSGPSFGSTGWSLLTILLVIAVAVIVGILVRGVRGTKTPHGVIHRRHLPIPDTRWPWRV